MKRIIASVLSLSILFMASACAPVEKAKEILHKLPVVQQNVMKTPQNTQKPNQPDLPQEEKTQYSKGKETVDPNAGVLAGKIIVVDPGHGLSSDKGNEPIAPNSKETKRKFVSGAAGKNQTEEELNLAVCLKLRDMLKAMGAQVYMTREGHETNLSNVERAKFGNDYHADLSVKIHADGSENRSLSGVSILIPGNTYIKDEVMLSKSRGAAECILEEFIKTTGAKNRGIVVRNDMTGFNWSAVPVVLVEMGFMSNPEEDAKMETAAYREQIARGIANGVAMYFAS